MPDTTRSGAAAIEQQKSALLDFYVKVGFLLIFWLTIRSLILASGNRSEAVLRLLELRWCHAYVWPNKARLAIRRWRFCLGQWRAGYVFEGFAILFSCILHQARISGFGSRSSVQVEPMFSASHMLLPVTSLKRIHITLGLSLDLVVGITLVIGEMVPRKPELLVLGWEGRFITSQVSVSFYSISNNGVWSFFSWRAYGRCHGFHASSWSNNHDMGSLAKSIASTASRRTWSIENWTWLDCRGWQLVYKVGKNRGCTKYSRSVQTQLIDHE